MDRRTFFKLAAALGLCPGRVLADMTANRNGSLSRAPIEMKGSWPEASPEVAARVAARVREICLTGVQLVSDRQPDRIIVDNHQQGSPAIWLHGDQPEAAWIILDVGPRDWCKLAYQLGHELGHVLCNSWEATARPRPPSQWLEEALVEAFSIRGLGMLARNWAERPPFEGDEAFGAAIADYRKKLLEMYRAEAAKERAADAAAWFHNDRKVLESGLAAPKGLAVLEIIALFDRDKKLVCDLGAANRWASRTGVPLEEYLTLWEKSCRETGAPGRLPAQLRNAFGVS
ncbi:hypothetical protein [Methylocystis parvus]|uniref:hypothetical protein n=1 Tax=Methylocystis parvus TaxID=134 RepID=UPI003C796F06